jgi:hypothetical protein
MPKFWYQHTSSKYCFNKWQCMVGILLQYFIKIMFQTFKKFNHYSIHTLHFQNVLEYCFKQKLCLMKIEITPIFLNNSSSTYKAWSLFNQCWNYTYFWIMVQAHLKFDHYSINIEITLLFLNNVQAQIKLDHYSTLFPNMLEFQTIFKKAKHSLSTSIHIQIWMKPKQSCIKQKHE